MRWSIPKEYSKRLPILLSELDYRLHCREGAEVCYHKRLHSMKFPRFHLLLLKLPNGSHLIKLHLDQYSPDRKGNHDCSWAYTGERVYTEGRHLVDHLSGIPHRCKGTIYLASHEDGFEIVKARRTRREPEERMWPWNWKMRTKM